MKAILCQFFRYKQSCKFIATEVGRFNSDFLAIKNNVVYEVEIKTSKSDLTNDFKKDKHKIYSSNKYTKLTPTYFYFAVPSDLVSFAINKVEGTKYGVIEILPEDSKVKQSMFESIATDLLEEKIAYITEQGAEDIKVKKVWNGEVSNIDYLLDVPLPVTDRLNIIKRASKIHNNQVSEEMKHAIISRCSSELAKLKYENFLLKKTN